MAKANVRFPDIDAEQAGKVALGRCFERALAKVGWSIDRAARELFRDPREIAKWMSGERRGHWDLVYGLSDENEEYVDLKEAFLVEQVKLVHALQMVREYRFVRRAVNS
jgi:hypothetical protein